MKLFINKIVCNINFIYDVFLPETGFLPEVGRR